MEWDNNQRKLEGVQRVVDDYCYLDAKLFCELCQNNLGHARIISKQALESP